MPAKVNGNVYDSIQASDALCESNVATTRLQVKWIKDERRGNDTVGVRNGMQRQDQNRTHPSGAGLKNDHGGRMNL